MGANSFSAIVSPLSSPFHSALSAFFDIGRFSAIFLDQRSMTTPLPTIPKALYDRLTQRARDAFQEAVNIAYNMKHAEVHDDHLLYSILVQEGSLVGRVLREHGVTIEFVLGVLNERPLRSTPPVPANGANAAKSKDFSPVFSRQLQETLQKAVTIAKHYQHQHVGLEHFAFAILHHRETEVDRALHAKNVAIPTLRQHLLALLGNTTQTTDISKFYEFLQHIGSNLASSLSSKSSDRATPARDDRAPQEPRFGETPSEQQQNGDVRVVVSRPENADDKQSALVYFTENLSQRARDGELDPVIGRDRELDRVVTILSRRLKNNPILIGEPGVGKTAIVHGLATRIEEGRVPELLLGKEVLSLDLASVIAGTSFRGEFEARLNDIIDDLERSEKYILFIDEIHMIVGAGSATGSLDAANILKPALTSGAFQCIGATTIDEFKKHFEKDAALERRFQSVRIVEPTSEETHKILKGLRSAFQRFHKLSITDDALQAAIDLSVRYLPDRFLPDKAIDLLDEAAANKRRAKKLPNVFHKLRTVKDEYQQLQNEKNRAIEEERYTDALHFKEQEQQMLENIKKLNRKKKAVEQKENLVVEERDIAEIVSMMTGIPVTSMNARELQSLRGLEERLKRRIIGQDDAIAVVARTVKRGRTGITNPGRPLGSFLFLGPTGVGKTEVARVLASEVYRTNDALMKIDMSEFGERHTVSRLLGAPAGYIGYEEGGTLTEKVRRQPYSILLFDEIDKAHPEVFNILLQILEDGVVTDASGRTVNFKNTVVILTSNIGSQDVKGTDTLGFSRTSRPVKNEKNGKKGTRRLHGISDRDRDAKLEQTAPEREREAKREAYMAELKEFMRPELLNRLDHVIVFDALDERAMLEIARLHLDELDERLRRSHGLTLTPTRSAVSWIARKGYDERYGARPLRRVIQEHIEDPLSDALLRERFTSGDTVAIDAATNTLTLRKRSRVRAS